MIGLIELIFYLFGALAVVYGCSEPEGGFKEPTPADNVHYATYVVVGKVTSLLRPDPMFGDMYDSTYGAMVDVQCTYKGGPLPARIKIGGAGFIPGLCTAMDLEQNKKYILFLREKRENEDMYEQSEMAANKSMLMDYLRVCNLNMEYPVEKGMMLKRAECPPATKLDMCHRHGDAQTQPPVVVEKATVKHRPVDMQGKEIEEGNKASVKKDTTGAGSASSTIISSFVTIMLALAIRTL